jgi:transcription elongation GreA/GreB family factor
MTATNLTEESQRQLRDELEVLRTQRRELTEGDDPTEVGDRADDAEALRRHADAARLDDRISELTRLLAGGLPAGMERDDDALPVGTQVTLEHADGETETLRVVAITEQARPGEEDSVLTLDSPLGVALAGRTAGDTIRYETPGGTHEAKVVAIDLP